MIYQNKFNMFLLPTQNTMLTLIQIIIPCIFSFYASTLAINSWNDLGLVFNRGRKYQSEFYTENCYFKIKLTKYKITMSSTQVEIVATRRISERHRLKMLRNSDQYKIANPYKQAPLSALPEDLNIQLRKIPFLSSTSISLIVVPNSFSQGSLLKMAEALRSQQDRFQALFGSSEETAMASEQSDNEMVTEPRRKESILAEDLIQTKEEVSHNVYEPQYPLHQNMFDCQNQTQEHDSLRLQSLPLQSCHLREEAMEEEYENYFAS